MAGYRQIEQAYKEGKVKSIGISNFYGKKLDQILKEAEIKPHVIQVEAHPYCSQHKLMELLTPYGTKLMAWYPLGHGDKTLIHQPIFGQLAKKYNKSNVQIILRWHYQKGFIVIPGSTNPDHIKSNIDIQDFTITEEEMAEIAQLDDKKQYYGDNYNEEAEAKYATMHFDIDGQE